MNSEKKVSRILVRGTVDGNPIENWDVRISGNILKLKPYSLAEIHKEIDEALPTVIGPREREFLKERKKLMKAPLTLFVFKISLGDYLGLEKELDNYDGKIIDMGEFPTLVVSDLPEANLLLEKERIYDAFAFSGQTFCGGRRLSTDYQIPFPVTLEEMKFFALKDCGVNLEEAKGVKARIIPMTGWGDYGKFLMAGFCLDYEKEHNLYDHTIRVQHNCEVSYYHGYDRRDFLPFFRKKKSFFSFLKRC